MAAQRGSSKSNRISDSVTLLMMSYALLVCWCDFLDMQSRLHDIQKKCFKPAKYSFDIAQCGQPRQSKRTLDYDSASIL